VNGERIGFARFESRARRAPSHAEVRSGRLGSGREPLHSEREWGKTVRTAFAQDPKVEGVGQLKVQVGQAVAFRFREHFDANLFRIADRFRIGLPVDGLCKDTGERLFIGEKPRLKSFDRDAACAGKRSMVGRLRSIHFLLRFPQAVLVNQQDDRIKGVPFGVAQPPDRLFINPASLPVNAPAVFPSIEFGVLDPGIQTPNERGERGLFVLSFADDQDAHQFVSDSTGASSAASALSPSPVQISPSWKRSSCR